MISITKRDITMKTNYNNKMSCDCFSHIDLAPARGIQESQMDSTVFLVRTADNSHPPTKAKLVSLVRFPLWKVCDIMSYPSHGIDSTSFQDKMMREHGISPDKEMAVYFYQRIVE